MMALETERLQMMNAVAVGGQSRNSIRRSVKIGRILFRLIVFVNAIHLLLLQFRSYFRDVNDLLARFSLQFADVDWMFASAVFLPLFVAVETWYLVRVPKQKRALIIDWIL